MKTKTKVGLNQVNLFQEILNIKQYKRERCLAGTYMFVAILTSMTLLLIPIGLIFAYLAILHYKKSKEFAQKIEKQYIQKIS